MTTNANAKISAPLSSAASRLASILLAALAVGVAQPLWAQQPPSWGNDSNPSPTAGSSVANEANAAANKGMYSDVTYVNASKPGPALIVLPGQIKSNNASFLAKVSPINIADFAELELSKANFQVLERADLGPILGEIQNAYTLGDAAAARKVMSRGKLKSTRWLVEFDILKVEHVAQRSNGFNGSTAARLIGIFGGGSRASDAAATVTDSTDTSSTAGVWVVGMRYRIIDAETTEQVAQYYTEEKMELGAKATSVGGFSSSASGGLSLDTLVQRLVQKCVWDIDYHHK